MSFGAPHLLWLYAVVPLIPLLLLWSHVRRKRDLERFASAVLAKKLTPTISRAWRINKTIALLLFVVFAVFALARPRFGVRMEMVERRGVDIMVALDVSHSMLARDIAPNRIERARHEIGRFIDMLRGDRFGLVLFAGESFVQCPLTLDYGAARMFLDAVGTDWIGLQGTDIGGAIRLASQAFRTQERKHKVLIIVSDGEEHDGDALAAAREAAAEGIRIFTIGIGSPDGVPIPVGQGATVTYLRDQEGNLALTRLNPLLLEQIALAGNGTYYHAGAHLHLGAIYNEIAAMEKRDLGMNLMTRYRERYQLFLLAALVFLLLEFFFPEGVRRKTVWRGRFES